MWRMWSGLEIVVVDLPPLVPHMQPSVKSLFIGNTAVHIVYFRVIRGRFDKMSQLIPYPRVGKRGPPFSFKGSIRV